MPIPQVTAIFRIQASKDRGEILSPFEIEESSISVEKAVKIGAWCLKYIMENSNDKND